MKRFNTPFLCGVAAGLIAGCFLGVWIAQKPTPEETLAQERAAVEKQKAALQMSIKALDAYYQMLTNAPKK